MRLIKSQRATLKGRKHARLEDIPGTDGGKDGLSAAGWDFIGRILASATDICLVLNSSVNSYRRLDPHFEAPNQIKASAIDRGSMAPAFPSGRSRGRRGPSTFLRAPSIR